MTAIASPDDDILLAQASLDFTQALVVVIERNYPDFPGWTDEAKTTAITILGAQMLLRPETFGAPMLNMDQAAHSLGIALGNRSAEFAEEALPQLINHFLAGFNYGRSDRNNTIANMPVAGRA